jgi:hypothetical protein
LQFQVIPAVLLKISWTLALSSPADLPEGAFIRALLALEDQHYSNYRCHKLLTTKQYALVVRRSDASIAGFEKNGQP